MSTKTFRARTRDIQRDILIVRGVATKKSFRSLGRELGLTGARVHQLYSRAIGDIYVTAGLSAPKHLRATLQQHPVMVERVLEHYQREHHAD